VKAPGQAANPPELTRYRTAIDELMAVLDEIQSPFIAAVATLERIRALPVSSPSALTSGTDACHKTALGLRALCGAEAMPAKMAEGLVQWEGSLRKLHAAEVEAK
jgi:hypothetical protein